MVIIDKVGVSGDATLCVVIFFSLTGDFEKNGVEGTK